MNEMRAVKDLAVGDVIQVEGFDGQMAVRKVELTRPEHIDRTRGDLRDKLDAKTLERLERLRRGN